MREDNQHRPLYRGDTKNTFFNDNLIFHKQNNFFSNICKSNILFNSQNNFVMGEAKVGSNKSQTPSFINCIYTNATSLNNKMSELETRLSLMSFPHLVFVAETWFGPQSAPGLKGYVLHRCDRKTRGGGVAIYIRDDVESFLVSVEALSNCEIEQVWCGLTFGSDCLLVGCIYRPPGLNSIGDEALFRTLREAKKLTGTRKFSSILVAGDFNFPDISWLPGGIGFVANTESVSGRFLSTLKDCFLAQCIHKSTFHRGDDDKSGNVLDLILTDAEARVLDVSILPPLGALQTAHSVLSWKYAVGKSEEVLFRVKRKWNCGKYQAMSSELTKLNWESRLLPTDLDSSYDLFSGINHDLCSKYVPIRGKSKRSRPKWFTEKIRELIKLKHKLWYRKMGCNSNSSKRKDIVENYRQVCLSVKLEISNAISTFEKELAKKAKRDPKLIFAYTKSKQKLKDHVKAITDRSGQLTTDRKKIADTLNDQFKSVFVVEQPCETHELPTFTQKTDKSFGVDQLIESFSEIEVEKLLVKLGSEKACGTDEIHPHVLKSCAQDFAKPLSIMFRRSLIEGQVPRQWKEANVSPIFKKGSRIDAANYRPVSLTSVVCKVMERLV